MQQPNLSNSELISGPTSKGIKLTICQQNTNVCHRPIEPKPNSIFGRHSQSPKSGGVYKTTEQRHVSQAVDKWNCTYVSKYGHVTERARAGLVTPWAFKLISR